MAAGGETFATGRLSLLGAFWVGGRLSAVSQLAQVVPADSPGLCVVGQKCNETVDATSDRRDPVK